MSGKLSARLKDPADRASAHPKLLAAQDGNGRDVLTPTKVLDLRDYGLKTSASAAVNTAAFTAALADAQAQKLGMFLAEGDYPVNQIIIPRVAQGQQVSIFANPGTRANLIKNSADGNGLFQLATSTTTGYTALLRFSNLGFQGFAGDSPFAFRAYDMVRCMFDFCQFNNANLGVDLQGGIGNSFFKCQIGSNVVGVNAKHYSSLIAGYPNLNRFIDCQIVDNTHLGVDFDDGRVLALIGCDIEGNGTAGNSAYGGVHVGANIGSEDPTNPKLAQGLIVSDSWCEANAGGFSIECNSGFNVIANTTFEADSAATYSTHMVGGRYALENCQFRANKTTSHKEESTIGAGNKIDLCSFRGLATFDTAKTLLIDDAAGLHTPDLYVSRIDAPTSAGTRVFSNLAHLLANIFESGTADSWVELVGGAGYAQISAGSSLANSDVKVVPKGTGLARMTNPQITSKAAPASAADTGTQGEVRWDASFIYICTATNTWKRVAIATW